VIVVAERFERSIKSRVSAFVKIFSVSNSSSEGCVKIFSSVKKIKSTANAGKRHKSFARDERDAQFLAVSSCARRFFRHFNRRWTVHKS